MRAVNVPRGESGNPTLPTKAAICSNLAVLQQQTLNRPASFSGIGLHSGNRVNMNFLPAEPNTGLRFRRVDLDGKPEIEARVENVSETNRSNGDPRSNGLGPRDVR